MTDVCVWSNLFQSLLLLQFSLIFTTLGTHDLRANTQKAVEDFRNFDFNSFWRIFEILHLYSAVAAELLRPTGLTSDNYCNVWTTDNEPGDDQLSTASEARGPRQADDRSV